MMRGGAQPAGRLGVSSHAADTMRQRTEVCQFFNWYDTVATPLTSTPAPPTNPERRLDPLRMR
jgi:hypothetical protein